MLEQSTRNVNSSLPIANVVAHQVSGNTIETFGTYKVVKFTLVSGGCFHSEPGSDTHDTDYTCQYVIHYFSAQNIRDQAVKFTSASRGFAGSFYISLFSIQCRRATRIYRLCVCVCVLVFSYCFCQMIKIFCRYYETFN